MKRYLVGGAIRDRLLGRPVRERDWVVIGETPESMAALGFRPVGRDFPVFLQPGTGEEHALARTERKTARGYHGFSFNAGPEVTLEQDLQRRDLTVNAMAEDDRGQLIDPYGGRSDLDNRLLRHVSPAFAEDPVRVLRVARFAARYHPLGFRVADETMSLMRNMAAAGEIEALVPERVWQEMQRALEEDSPGVFIDTLRDAGALPILLPEIDALFGVPQKAEYHPEVDSGVHTLLTLAQAVRLGGSGPARFAALCHDLGKARTPRAQWPSHRRHEHRGLRPLETLCRRLKVPREYAELAALVVRHHLDVHRIEEQRPATVVNLFDRLDAFRRPRRIEPFLLACEADARGRLGYEDTPYPQAAHFRAALAAAQSVDTRELIEQGLSGPEIGLALRERRIQAVRGWRRQAGDAAPGA